MFNEFFVKNRTIINRIVIFIISFIVIFFSFSKERKFRYEFKKGSPWQHDDLFAPYDFAIYKLDNEIQNEIDSINNNPKIYFILDKSIQDKQTRMLKDDFETKWIKFTKQDSIKRANDKSYKRNTPRLQKSKYITYFNKAIEYSNFIFQKGVFDPSEIKSYYTSDNYKLVFNKNNFVKTYMRDQVFTTQTAYTYINSTFNDELNNQNDELIKQFFDELNIEKYITKNLFFNLQKTEELKQLAIGNISKTRGYIQSGELVIARGEIVTIDKFRILQSLKTDYEHSVGKNGLLLIQLGNALVIFILLIMIIIFLANNKKKIYNDTPSFFMLFSLLVIFVGIFAIVTKKNLFNIYIIPLALIPMMVKVFFDERVALFILLITITLIGFIVPNGFEFVVIQFIAGFASIFGLTHLSRRGQIYISAISTFIAMSIIYFAIAIIQEGMISKINGVYFLYFALYSLLLMLAYPLIYGFERLFGFISEITLLELSNTNHELLQKLASSAPGTFQHSIQVASLAEAAANEIGGNPLLVKVGAMYHDIGKIASPAFFIENQVTGFNPHDQIDFNQSAQIIINHVAQGITFATKSKLPQQVIDFIRTHHGTTTVQYFYRNYIKKYPEKADEIANFTYPGPRPFSKETAILMMADSIEAASRSLKQINYDTISNLVDGIIDYQMNAKQYEEADITFKDIFNIKQLFKERLLNIYHARIEYPK